jgi:hypothetical protein
MENLIASFAAKVGSGNIEIYNEFSLQHELGIYLRGSLNNKKVQFERNVSFFGLNKANFVKREYQALCRVIGSMKRRDLISN